MPAAILSPPPSWARMQATPAKMKKGTSFFKCPCIFLLYDCLKKTKGTSCSVPALELLVEGGATMSMQSAYAVILVVSPPTTLGQHAGHPYSPFARMLVFFLFYSMIEQKH